MKKAIIKILSSLLCVLSCVTPVSAEGRNAEETITIYEMSEEEVNKMEDACMSSSSIIIPNGATDYIYEKEHYYTYYTNWCNEKKAFNQPSGGTVFTTANSGFYWSDSKKTDGNFTVSFTYGGKNWNISVQYQPGTVAQSSGYFAGISSSQVNHYVKLFVQRKYKIIIEKIYKRDLSTNTRTFERYQETKIPVSQKFIVRTVG